MCVIIVCTLACGCTRKYTHYLEEQRRSPNTSGWVWPGRSAACTQMGHVLYACSGQRALGRHRVASGLIDSSQQLGGAIGIAVASTVAAARSRVLLGQGHAIADALTGGFHWAFWVCGLVGLTAVPVAFLLVRRGP
jgi:hypothetical protein